MTTESLRRKRVERALQFRQCPLCTFDLATGEGERSCHYYGCPYLPDELNVVCPTCNYNFHTQDTTPGCGDPPTCMFAVDDVPERLDTFRLWLERSR